MGQLDVDYHISQQISQKPRLRLDYSLAFLVEILAGRIAHRLAEILTEEATPQDFSRFIIFGLLPYRARGR